MQVPILKQRDYLIASIQSALSYQDWLRLRDDLSERVGQFGSRRVIIGVTVRPQNAKQPGQVRNFARRS